MASISFATDKQLKKLKGGFNPNAFQFILVSSDLHMAKKKKGKETNIADASALMPPSEIVRQLVDGNLEKYQQHYLQFLLIERADMIAVIVKAALEKEMDIVLVCTNDEYEDFLYLELLSQFIEDEYKIDVHEFKKIIKSKAIPNYKDELKPKKIKKALEKANKVVAYKEDGKSKKKKKKKKK